MIPCRRLRTYRSLALLAIGLAGCADSETEPPGAPVDPEVRALVARAQEALERRDYVLGLARADSASGRAPGLPEVDFVRGRLFFELGRLDSARAAYERVLAREPDFEGAWHNLGNVAFRQKRYREALAHYRREAEGSPGPNPRHGMGGAYWMLGLPDSARWAYEQAVAADSAYAPAYASLADWHESGAAFEEALAYARKALALDSGHLGYRYKVGALSLRAGQAEEAERRLRPVLEEEPWNYGAAFNLGQALRRLGRDDEARRMLARADSIRALQADVERLGQTAADYPDNFQVQLDYADALRRTGRLADALAAFHVALSLRPENLALHNNVATLYLQQGRTEEALARYQAILARDSTFAETWLNLGLYHARAGREAEARAAWEKAFAYGAGNPAVQAFRRRLQGR